MAKQRTVKVELKDAHGHRPDLSDFASVVNSLRESLRHVWRCATHNDDLEFEISDLRFSSAIIETAPSARDFELGGLVADLYNDTVFALQNDIPLDPRIDYRAIQAFSGFATVAKKGAALKIGRVAIGTPYIERVAELLEPDTKSLGSVTGRLEGLTIHGNDRFILYPPVANEKVECRFDRSALPSVLAAVDKTVTVYGVLHYAKTKSFPVRVEVEKFEIIADESFPTLLNACGMLNLPSSSVDSIREMRDEWR